MLKISNSGGTEIPNGYGKTHITAITEQTVNGGYVEYNPIDAYPQTYSGEKIHTASYGFKTVKSSAIPSAMTQAVQGAAIYGNYMFITGNDKVSCINMPGLTIATANMSVTTGHGNGAGFSNQFYDSDDSFPLLYTCASHWAGGSNPVVYALRVTTSSATLVKTIKCANFLGYYSTGTVSGHLLYILGFTQNSTEAGSGNRLHCGIFDLDVLTDNGDDTYSPELVKDFYLDYMSVLQGCSVFDGRFWVERYNETSHKTDVLGIDPVTEKIVTNVSGIGSKESEGIDWYFDSDKGIYQMVVVYNGGDTQFFEFER